jgi:hypothetical protein
MGFAEMPEGNVARTLRGAATQRAQIGHFG